MPSTTGTAVPKISLPEYEAAGSRYSSMALKKR